MSSVIFGDQGVDEVYDCAGATVGMFKQRLRDSHNIPYFADAIVNGEIVPVAYVLGDGDRLCFRKRFGVKGGDDRLFEEREAEGLIHAYGLDEIAAEVKVRNLPKDESIDLMAVMVGKWAAQRFGRPAEQDKSILAEIVKRLDAIEARLKIPNQEEFHDGIRSTNQRVEQFQQFRLRVNEAENVVVVGNDHYVMEQRYVAVIACLLNANGAWLSGAEMSRQKDCLEFDDRIDRLIAKLQSDYPKVGKYIESVRGRGFRLILT